MHVYQGHAAMVSDPIELSVPNVASFLFEKHEKCRILRQCIWEFDITRPTGRWGIVGGGGTGGMGVLMAVIIYALDEKPGAAMSFAAAIGSRNPKGEYSAHTVRLWLKGIRIKGRRIIFHV